METFNFLNMEKQSHLHEDNFHYSQRLFEGPISQTNIQLESNFKFDYVQKNNLLEYPTKITTHQNNFENFGADFHLWDEFPPLLCEDAWEPLKQLHPLPYISNNSKLITFDDNDTDDFLLANASFNDQSLSMVVAEGFNMPKQGKRSMEEKIIGDNEKNEGIIRRIKGNNSNKVMKIDAINYEDIRKYFDMPISKAAKELNVGLTVLKKRCRELNIKRWPHRKIKSLEALICNVKEQGMIEMVKVLEDYKKKLRSMPWLELSEETKKLRQACFKANYKKKRALALTHL